MIGMPTIGAIVRQRENVLARRLDNLAQSELFHRQFSVERDEDGVHYVPRPDYKAALAAFGEVRGG